MPPRGDGASLGEGLTTPTPNPLVGLGRGIGKGGGKGYGMERERKGKRWRARRVYRAKRRSAEGEESAWSGQNAPSRLWVRDAPGIFFEFLHASLYILVLLWRRLRRPTVSG